jgi:hypothetical protein
MISVIEYFQLINIFLICMIGIVFVLIVAGDVHGGAAAAATAAAPRPPWRWRRGCGRFWKKSSRQRRGRGIGFGKNHRGGGAAAARRRGSGSIFFEDIEKLHEFGRISVFTNETP